jgi:hypothetical protein
VWPWFRGVGDRRVDRSRKGFALDVFRRYRALIPCDILGKGVLPLRGTPCVFIFFDKERFTVRVYIGGLTNNLKRIYIKFVTKKDSRRI